MCTNYKVFLGALNDFCLWKMICTLWTLPAPLCSLCKEVEIWVLMKKWATNGFFGASKTNMAMENNLHTLETPYYTFAISSRRLKFEIWLMKEVYMESNVLWSPENEYGFETNTHALGGLFSDRNNSPFVYLK